MHHQTWNVHVHLVGDWQEVNYVLGMIKPLDLSCHDIILYIHTADPD